MFEVVTVGHEKTFVVDEYVRNVGRAAPVDCIFAKYTKVMSVQEEGLVSENETGDVEVA